VPAFTRTMIHLTLTAAVWVLCSLPAAADKPVKVYILSGQSNMVGIGQVSGGGSRWGSEFLDPAVSVYPGAYDPDADYDTIEPIKTLKLEKFGGVTPTPYPGGGTHVVRGFIQPTTTGVYEFRPGYGGSTHNVMEVDGVEVYRKEVGRDAAHKHIKLTADKKVPFKITYLTEQANGLGWIARIDIPGTLATVVKQDGKFPYLNDDNGKWVERKDVWYKGVVTAGANKWLSVGCGAGNDQIGPELGFGHVIGDYHDEPVLILKASQGNRSLAWDYLPPGSERYEHEGKVYAGYKDSPAVWDKDTGSAVHAERYEKNLVHLIKTLRKEFKAPEAPFVIATIGFGGWEMSGNALTVANAQLAVSGENGKYREFKGNVQTVETRGFWRDAEVSPRNQGYHYNQNAETYMLVGESLGKGMMELLRKE